MSADAALRELTGALERRIDEIVAAMTERMREEVPEFFDSDDQVWADVCTQSGYATVRYILKALAHGRDGTVDPPGAAIDEARLTAQNGIALDSLLRTYHVGHAVFWEILMDESELLAVSPETRAAVLKLSSRYVFSYVDKVVPVITAAYQQERDARFNDRERRRRQLVRDLLARLPVDEARLAYDLQRWHQGFIAWGDEPERALAAISSLLGGQMLTVTGGGDSVWGWVGGEERALSDPRTLSSLEPLGGTFVAAGEPAFDVEGFRRTHREAWHAYRVARCNPRPLTCYRGVALEALALQDETLARQFVERELGFLAQDDERAATLRETFRAYLVTGQNAAAAAAMLGVHERTVAYRLRSAEERLSVSLTARRDEIAVALRLFELLGRNGSEETA